MGVTRIAPYSIAFSGSITFLCQDALKGLSQKIFGCIFGPVLISQGRFWQICQRVSKSVKAGSWEHIGVLRVYTLFRKAELSTEKNGCELEYSKTILQESAFTLITSSTPRNGPIHQIF